MNAINESYTGKLAEFCAGVTLSQLPNEVIDKTKLCILDFIANVYGSLELDAVQRVAEYIRSLGGPDTAAALGCGFRTGVHNAAFLNGTAGEAIESQDGLRFGGNHPGAAVIPAALAIAEQNGQGGARVIEAVVAGYEAANRPAAAVHPHHTLSGFLPTGTCGAFGAAAAAAKLMGYDAETTLNALGAAGFILPISMAEHLMGGYTAKIVQGGQAASAGLTAAGLAGAGITAPPYTLEGSHLKGGFTQITTRGSADIKKVTENIGDKYTIMDIYFKPYTSCRHTHGAAQAALELKADETFSAAEIEKIDVFTYAIATVAVGKTIGAGDSFVSAQFSLPYVVAACLTDGDMSAAQLKSERISDQAIIALANKVKLSIDPELNKAYPEKTSSRVEVLLAGGRALSRQVDIPKGDPRNSMGADDIAEKLKRYAANRKSGNMEKIIKLVLDMENVGSIRELTSLI
ncbi:MAG: MmgE/PrpD family protein [bacterium]